MTHCVSIANNLCVYNINSVLMSCNPVYIRQWWYYIALIVIHMMLHDWKWVNWAKQHWHAITPQYMQHVHNIPRHFVTVRPVRGYPNKYLYPLQWTELSLQLISLRWFVKVIITLILFLLFYHLVITALLNSDINITTVS